MKKNIGNIDRVARIIFAIIAGYFAYKFQFEDWKSYILTGFSLLMIVTAIKKSCPLYYIFGMSSYKIEL